MHIISPDFKLGSDNGKSHQDIKDRKEKEDRIPISLRPLAKSHPALEALILLIISNEQNLGLGVVNSCTANQPARRCTILCGSPIQHLYK